eukprot:6434646-Pyramimonas_sp.AAC.1
MPRKHFALCTGISAPECSSAPVHARERALAQGRISAPMSLRSGSETSSRMSRPRHQYSTSSSSSSCHFLSSLPPFLYFRMSVRTVVITCSSTA